MGRNSAADFNSMAARRGVAKQVGSGDPDTTAESNIAVRKLAIGNAFEEVEAFHKMFFRFAAGWKCISGNADRLMALAVCHDNQGMVIGDGGLPGKVKSDMDVSCELTRRSGRPAKRPDEES
jgi:hypothetical protein